MKVGQMQEDEMGTSYDVEESCPVLDFAIMIELEMKKLEYFDVMWWIADDAVEVWVGLSVESDL
jgi:hypothetical protein